MNLQLHKKSQICEIWTLKKVCMWHKIHLLYCGGHNSNRIARSKLWIWRKKSELQDIN